jgi:hypothetical protein
MEKEFTFQLSKDFWILCTLFQKPPQEVLQYYINHISVPLFMDVSIENPFGAATRFFILHSRLDEAGEECP